VAKKTTLRLSLVAWLAGFAAVTALTPMASRSLVASVAAIGLAATVGLAKLASP
jgi:hypothetical protein